MLTPEEQNEFNEMSAFVKANGYLKLDSHEKRNRYRELKEKIDKDNEVMPMTRSEVEAMIAKAVDSYKEEAKKKSANEEELDEVIKLNTWMKARKERVENKRAKLRVFHNDGGEIGVVTSLIVKKTPGFNEETRQYDVPIAMITVLYDDGTEQKYEQPLLQLVSEGEFEDVEILKRDREELEMVQGKGRKAFNASGYNFSSPSFFGTKMQPSGEEFDFVVKGFKEMITAKRPNGKTVILPAERFNT